MLDTARLFNCGRRGRQVVICGRCDRGRRYCHEGCAPAARRESRRTAGARYQHSRRGRLAHVECQHRYRAGRQKVTHQGSPTPALGDSAAPESRASAPPPGEPAPEDLCCHFCGRVSGAFVRLDFVRQRRDEPSVQRSPPWPARSP